MRCPSCTKFAAYDTSSEPEIDVYVESRNDGQEAEITGSARIVLTAECCGDELKETTFDIDVFLDVNKADGCECGDEWANTLEVETDGSEITERQESTRAKTYKTGPKKGQTVQIPIPYRYQRRYFGCSSNLVVNCGCGKEVGRTEFSDEVQASAMEELI